MQIHELTPPPEITPPEWQRQLRRFVRSAGVHDRIDMRVALEMQDRDRAQKLLENYSDTAILERKKKKKKKKAAKRTFKYGRFGGWWYPGFHDESGATADSGGGGGGESVREASTPDGVSPSTQMFLNEAEKTGILKDFITRTMQRLRLADPPRVIFHKNSTWAEQNRSFGQFDPESNTLHVSLPDRHVMDIMRTIAHELTHAKQNEQHTLPDTAGETGSTWENSANAMAGIIMRDMAQENPDLFEADLTEGVLNKAAAAAALSAALAMPAGAQDQTQDLEPQRGPTIGQVLGTALKLYGISRIREPQVRAEVEQEFRNYLRAQQGDANAQNQSEIYQWEREQRRVDEASGYIPTAKQRRDPRFKTALTVDVKPGQTGREANKLALDTDAQGRPGLLTKQLANALREFKEKDIVSERCWTGYRQDGMKKKGDRMVPNCVKVTDETVTPVAPPAPAQQRSAQPTWPRKKGQRPDGGAFRDALRRAVTEDEDLVEVDMSPGALKRWAKSDAAQRVRVGFEFEMYFPNTSSDDSEDDPYDYDRDDRPHSIQDVIDFFSEGNNPSPRGTLNRLEAQMYDRYSDWRQEAIDGEMTESGFFEFMDEKDDTEDIRTDKQAEFRLEAEEELGDEAGRDEISDRVQELWINWVDTQWNRGDSVYMEQYRDYVSEAQEENFSEGAWLRSEYRYMSDVQNEWSLDWPHMNERYREGGQAPEAWADELSSVIGMPVKFGGYHGTRRGEDHANLEYDSSLDEPESDEDAGLELITPYRPLPEALQILDSVIEFANRMGIYTNSSTGLHMNVSLEDVKNVDWVKLVMFMGDTYILDTFERRANTYARSSMMKLMDKVRERRAEQPVQEQDEDRAIYGGEIDIDRAMGLMRDNMIELARQAVQSGLGRDKYQSVHVKPLDDGGSYIEFRGPGGDWLGKQDENADVLRNTVFRLGRAMEIAADPEAERREYAKKLYKTLTPEMPQLRSAIQMFSLYSAGAINSEQLKREWAEAVLQAERDKIAKSRNNEGIYKIVDNTTGEVLDRYEAGSDGEALEYAMSNWAGRGINYDIKREVRDTEATPKEKRRRDLARRVAGNPTWWRVSITGRPQYTGWIQAPTRAKAIQDYERRTGIEGTYDRKTFDARVEEPAPLRDPGAAPDTIRGRTFYHIRHTFRRGANWALVDDDGVVRIAFPAPDQQAAEDRLRSWQSEEPDQERWLVSLQPAPDIRASDPEWQVTWTQPEPASVTVRAKNAQQAIDLAKMANGTARQSTDIRAERTDSEDQAQSTTATSINQPGGGRRSWLVTWDEYRERDGERIRFSDALRVEAHSAWLATDQVINSLRAQGRRHFNINAEPTDSEADSQSQTSSTATSLNLPGEGESDWRVLWSEYRDRNGREELVQDSIRVVAGSAREATDRLRNSLRAQGRNPFNINAEPTDPPPWRQNIAPAATSNITNPLHQTQGEFTGRWLVQSTVTGETVHTISGIGNVQDLHIGNVQADANRQAARWAQSTGFDDPIEVVPEMG